MPVCVWVCGYRLREEEVKVHEKEGGGGRGKEGERQEKNFKIFVKIIYLRWYFSFEKSVF